MNGHVIAIEVASVMIEAMLNIRSQRRSGRQPDRLGK